jgi:hypothetical protein
MLLAFVRLAVLPDEIRVHFRRDTVAEQLGVIGHGQELMRVAGIVDHFGVGRAHVGRNDVLEHLGITRDEYMDDASFVGHLRPSNLSLRHISRVRHDVALVELVGRFGHTALEPLVGGSVDECRDDGAHKRGQQQEFTTNRIKKC